MQNFEFTHRRKNPLTNRWVLVSPHRNNRPWQGATEAFEDAALPAHDESCPLCAGNVRANGETNPNYQQTFVFKNDFAALQEQTETLNETDPLFSASSATGECRVICFSPEHNKTLPELSLADIEAVIDTWQQQYTELSKQYNCVHIFENKGEIMGCSQPHPHGQIWAHNHLSTEIEQENSNQLAYFQQYQSPLLLDYATKEQQQASRVVIENEYWLVVVPYWAAWPFETLLLPKFSIADFSELSAQQKPALAAIIQQLTIKYDNIFQCRFPYSMGWHCAPAKLENKSHWQMHAHFYPPLLRSATVKKHMVGYEMLAESQRDLTAETAANILRETSDQHYKQGN